MEELTQSLQPILITVIGILAVALTKYIISYLKKGKESLIQKIGQTQYDRAYNVAVGLYYLIEETYPELKEKGEEKKAEMEKLLLETFPTLTQAELDSINKQVCETIKEESQTLINE